MILRFATAAVLTFALAASAQQPSVLATPSTHTIHLNVMVTSKRGEPVSGLTQQDFTLLDNKAAATITSFRAVQPGQKAVQIILLVDAVTTNVSTMASIRIKLKDFLHSNGGHLAYPTTVAVSSYSGVSMRQDFTTNGNALASAVDSLPSGVRKYSGNSGGIGQETEELNISFHALDYLLTQFASYPGRNVIIWISPGWPTLGGPNYAHSLPLDKKRQILSNIANLSTRLRSLNVTLYNINPIGEMQNLLNSDYRQFIRGVSDPNEVSFANLSLPVLATQSGGQVFEADADVTAPLRNCYSDIEPWYELTFDAPPVEHPDEYHHLQLTVSKPGLNARTREGYYAQP